MKNWYLLVAALVMFTSACSPSRTDSRGFKVGQCIAFAGTVMQFVEEGEFSFVVRDGHGNQYIIPKDRLDNVTRIDCFDMFGPRGNKS